MAWVISVRNNYRVSGKILRKEGTTIYVWGSFVKKTHCLKNILNFTGSNLGKIVFFFEGPNRNLSVYFLQVFQPKQRRGA